jgi:hypothetical protein
MTEQKQSSGRARFGLRDITGTTVALTSLAVLGAAAIVSTPLWLWYTRKRKRTDAMIREAAAASADSRKAEKDETPPSAIRPEE